MNQPPPNDHTNEKELDARRDLVFLATRDASVVFEILKEYPHLAQKVTFPCDCPCNKHGRHSLLTQLISCNASTSTVLQVTQLYPNALLYDKTFCGPLHVACANTPNSTTMVDYLLQQYPQAVTTPDSHGNLPLHYALSHSQIPLETIQLLVETACDDSNDNTQTITTPNVKGETPLQKAILKACRDDNDQDVIIPYLVGKLQDVDYEFGHGKNTTFNAKRCQALIHILPKLNSLVCRPSQWTWDALFLLLKHLSSSNTNNMQRICLEGIPRVFLTTNRKMTTALELILLTNTCLAEVHLEICNTWHDKNRKADQRCLESLLETLTPLQGRGMPKVYLSLVSFQLYQSPVSKFLQQAQPLITSLSLYASTILEDRKEADHRQEAIVANNTSTTSDTHHQNRGHPNNAPSLLERLELVKCHMAPSILEDLLVQIQQTMPRIKHLKLVFREEIVGEPFDLTKFVEQMLYNYYNNHAPLSSVTDITTSGNTSSSLQSLTIKGLHVDNQLLKHYATTNTFNTSTGTRTMTASPCCYIQYSQFGKSWGSVKYATALKRFGLRHCQDEERATKVSLVAFLKELEAFNEMEDTYKTVIRFGILQECPSLWTAGIR